ncbi:MAG: PH domain-containing protein [Clostridium sp.]
MEFEKLNKKSKKSWLISRAIVTGIIATILIVIRVIISRNVPQDFLNKNGIFIDIGIGIILVLLLLNTFVYPAFEYKQWSYLITKDKIEFTEGIFFVRRVIIPIIRVQHIQVNQGPINRLLNLATITICTAGGNHQIPNIDIQRAEEISGYLKNKVQEKVEQNV